MIRYNALTFVTLVCSAIFMFPSSFVDVSINADDDIFQMQFLLAL